MVDALLASKSFAGRSSEFGRRASGQIIMIWACFEHADLSL
jgi:hypothetical protein